MHEPTAMLLVESDRGLIIACINLAGSISLAVGIRIFTRRLDWREGVNRKLARLFEKFRILKDRHGLDTTPEDDGE